MCIIILLCRTLPSRTEAAQQQQSPSDRRHHRAILILSPHLPHPGAPVRSLFLAMVNARCTSFHGPSLPPSPKPCKSVLFVLQGPFCRCTFGAALVCRWAVRTAYLLATPAEPISNRTHIQRSIPFLAMVIACYMLHGAPFRHRQAAPHTHTLIIMAERQVKVSTRQAAEGPAGKLQGGVGGKAEGVDVERVRREWEQWRLREETAFAKRLREKVSFTGVVVCTTT